MFTRRMPLALLLAALLCALSAWADSTARIVRLSYVDGDVQIARGAGQEMEHAVLNLPVVQGAQLVTRPAATAEVEFEDGSTLRLVPDSTVDFRQLSLRSNGERVSSIELAQGTAYLEARTKRDAYTITAGGQEISLTHDARLRVNRVASELTLAVFKGEVEVKNPNGSVRVKKNETLNLDLNDPSQYKLAKGVEPQGYDAWSRQRDQYRQTYASNRHDGYNPLYSYGWNDLNYFGNFYAYPGYGMLWQPYGVGPGWSPFADGAWMFYPGYGYMWVSGYPWGWMPYRYGSWTFVPGFGWGWSPATVWNTWYTTPVIAGAPAGFVAPAPPVVTKPAPGTTSPKTVVVGSGPIVDVRNPRFRQWVDQTTTASAPVRKTSLTPVPAPAPTTTAGTSGAQKTTTAKPGTSTRSAPSSATRQTAPARLASPPPSAPARTEAPRMSVPERSVPESHPAERAPEPRSRWMGGEASSAPHPVSLRK
jgi:Family of unknown function (DUF6600)/FecR protein